MSVLANNSTRVLCQGCTGSQGTLHSEQCIAYGTRMVAPTTSQVRFTFGTAP